MATENLNPTVKDVADSFEKLISFSVQTLEISEALVLVEALAEIARIFSTSSPDFLAEVARRNEATDADADADADADDDLG